MPRTRHRLGVRKSLDTDPLWGIGGDWAWKSFLRAHNPICMDAYDGVAVGSGAPPDFDIRHVGLDHGVGHFRPLSITRQRHLLTYHGTALSHEGLRQVF